MANQKYFAIVVTILFVALFQFLSCDQVVQSDSEELDDSVEFIPSVTPIEEASSTTLTVNRSTEAYFSLKLEGIENNTIVNNGTHEGWCIDYNKPIDSSNGIYQGLQLYSSYLTEAWSSLNYFLNIKSDLKSEDPDLTFREIQVVIWSLMPFPEFDLDNISNEDFPSRMLENGQRNFDERKIKEILDIVESNYRDFEYEENSRFAIVIETPADVQTVIIVSE